MLAIYRRWIFAALLSAGLVASFAAVTAARQDRLGALSIALADPLAILTRRSPGQRAAGALSDTKAWPGSPSPRPAGGGPPRRLTLPYAPEGWLSSPDGAIPPPGDEASTLGPIVRSALPGGITSPTMFGAGPDGGGSAEHIDGGPPIDIYRPPVLGPTAPSLPVADTPGGPPMSTVLEPASWLMMIIGFFTVGAIQRHARTPRGVLPAGSR